jgi:hypothetical protein
MNFVKIEDSCAILKFANTSTPEHRNVLMDVSALMQFGFSCFIFDFSEVKNFSSSILGFALGLIRVVKGNGCKMYVRNLSEEARTMLQFSVKVEACSDELCELLSLKNMQSVELGGSNGH